MNDKTAKKCIVALLIMLILIGTALMLQGCDKLGQSIDPIVNADANQVGGARAVVNTVSEVTKHLPIPGKDTVLGGLVLLGGFLTRRENKLRKKKEKQLKSNQKL